MKMLFYSKRSKLVKLFEKYCQENNLDENDKVNLITWLHMMDLLDVDNIEEILKEEIMQYVKKPIPIEAVKVEKENREQIIKLLQKGVTGWEELEDGFIVHSWEGVEPVKYGSNYWIIKGIKGECYPCEGTVFDESYELYTPNKMR